MPEAQLTIQLDPLLLRELPLLLLELQSDVEQSLLDALGRHRLREERQVVAEHQDSGGGLDPLIPNPQALDENRRPWRPGFLASPPAPDRRPLLPPRDRPEADF